MGTTRSPWRFVSIYSSKGDAWRPRSDDKRDAILLAATQISAERGLGAPTAVIIRLRRSWGGDTPLYQLECDVFRTAQGPETASNAEPAHPGVEGLGLRFVCRDRGMARDAREQYMFRTFLWVSFGDDGDRGSDYDGIHGFESR